MNVSAIKYKLKEATQKDIYCHLIECDTNFTPVLSSKVTVSEYASKIFDNAVTFEAWSDNMLVGLVAAYFNDTNNITGYITNVSILKNYMRQGIAGKLMKASINYARKHEFDEIMLEVSSANDSAIQLYRKFGFECFGIKNGVMQMKVSGLKDLANA